MPVYELIMLGIGLVLTIGTGLFVASEFSLVNLDRCRPRGARDRGETRLALTIGALKITSTHLSSAQLGITLTTLLTGSRMEPAISSPAAPAARPRSGMPAGRRRRRSRPSSPIVDRHPAVDDHRRTGAEELRPRPAAGRPPSSCIPFQVGVHRGVQPGGRAAQRHAPTACCARSASSRRRSCLGAAPPRSSSSLVRRSASEGALERDTATLLARTLAFSRPHRRRRDDAAPAASRASTAPTPRRPSSSSPRSTGYSRFPVIDDDIDDVVGIVHVKQAVAVPRERRARRAGLRAAVRRAARAGDHEARHPARRAARPRLPDGGRRRRVRRHRRRRHPRGPRRGARRRGRRRARPHARRRRAQPRLADLPRHRCAPTSCSSAPASRVPEDGPVRDGRRLPDERARTAPRRRRHRRRSTAGEFRVERMDGRRIDRVRFTPTPDDDRDGEASDERLGGNRLAGRAAARQRLLRRRRVRGHLGAPLADRAARRGGIARREDRAVGDGARDAHAGDEPARHHGLLAADPERLGAGDPPPARGAARTSPAGRRR